MKLLFAILLLFIVTIDIQAQDKRGTIQVEKSKKKQIIKPCICGQTDTLFASRIDLLDKKFIRLDLCGDKNNILKYTVVRFNSTVVNSRDSCLSCFDNRIDGWLWYVARFSPKTSTIVIKDVQYNTGNGIATLPSNLVISLTD